VSDGGAASYETFARKARGEALSGAARCKEIGLGRTSGELREAAEEDLWRWHAAALEKSRGDGSQERAPEEASLLTLKRELAERLLGPSCRLCFLRCPVDRRPPERGGPERGAAQRGACGLGAGLRPYQDFVHLGEELELIPTHAVYLAGCNYRCAYCSDWAAVVRPEEIAEVAPEVLARSIEARRREGAASLSLIGGVPDVSLPAILAALEAAEVSVPLVWNSNLSATPEAADLLEGLVDAYVADLKYGSEDCAQEGSAVKGSLAVTQGLLARCAREAYLVVRHLVLPGHVTCCTEPALDWLAETLPGVRLNLMSHYLPPEQVQGTSWDRLPRADELAGARARAESLGFELAGPGLLALEAGPGADASTQPVAGAAGFSSEIRIEPGGRVVIENLSPELLGIVESLGAELPELELRKLAGEAWRSAEES
jgi:putative pyruvate formate lyase activating enzyme